MNDMCDMCCFGTHSEVWMYATLDESVGFLDSLGGAFPALLSMIFCTWHIYLCIYIYTFIGTSVTSVYPFDFA